MLDIDAQINGSWLDSYIYLIDSDGVTTLAQNDDAEDSLDSKLGYQLPYSGTYYVKVRAYSHPNAGGTNHFYTLHLYTDNDIPSAQITAPLDNEWIDPDLVTIIATASDNESGVNRVEFLWHDSDWINSDWVWLGADYYDWDGWSWNFDTSTLPEQQGGAFYTWTFDWVGNWVGDGSWNLGIDRTPPTVSATVYPMYGDAPFRDFWVNWWNSSDNLSGIASYDVQYRDGANGVWTDLVTNTTDVSYRFVGEDGHTYYFRARARDNAGNQSVYASGDGDTQYTVQTCAASPDMYETDNDYTNANWIVADGPSQTHNAHVEGDEDWVKFSATAGITYTLKTANLGGHADTRLYLYDTDGSTLIEFNDDYPGMWPASRVDWQPATSGVYYAKVDHWDPWAYGCTTEYDLSIVTIIPPANDDIDNAEMIFNTPYNNVQSTIWATTAGDDPDFVCGSGDQGSASVWYRFTPTTNGVLTANTESSNYDTVLAVWNGSRGALTSVACDDDSGAGLTSSLTTNLTGATTYYIEVAQYGAGMQDPGGALELTVDFTPCYTLSTDVNPGGNGSVSANPAPNCTNGTQYTEGTIVELTASANSGYIFTDWSGDASGSSNPVSVAMNNDKSVTANFTQDSGQPKPELRIPGNIQTYSGQDVTVPVNFTGNGTSIASTIFSVDFDQTCLDFDPTDSDLDGIPDAVTFHAPGAFGVSVTYDANDANGELDFLIADTLPPLSALSDGDLLDIIFTATCQPPADASMIASVNFSDDPAASFGNTNGQSEPGNTYDGSVEILPGMPGNCNGDQAVDAGDISALVLEVFDGDGNSPADTPGGTFPGNASCDANEDGVVDAGDISCMALLIFEGPGACTSGLFPPWEEPTMSSAEPALAIPDQEPAFADGAVTIPITFTANSNDISSLIFSINYDETWLTFDSTDSNSDGIPDAVAFDLPGVFNPSVTFDGSDTDGELDFFIADIIPPLSALSDGTIVHITLNVGNPPDATEASIKFSQTPSASFGNTSGQSVPGTTNNGSVLITQGFKTYLPVILNKP